MNAENKLGKKIKNLRQAKGYTQEQLAELVNIDNKHISKIENGKHLPSYKTLKKLSEILSFNLQDIDVLANCEQDIKRGPIYTKAMKVLNSAKNEKELSSYYEALKLVNKIINS